MLKHVFSVYMIQFLFYSYAPPFHQKGEVLLGQQQDNQFLFQSATEVIPCIMESQTFKDVWSNLLLKAVYLVQTIREHFVQKSRPNFKNGTSPFEKKKTKECMLKEIRISESWTINTMSSWTNLYPPLSTYT